MDIFLKATAAVLIAVVLCLVLDKQNKDISLLLTLAACCMIVIVAINFLEPVMDFFRQLQSIGGLDADLLEILLKTTGIGLLTEIAALVCADVGNATLGKALQFLAAAVILWLSLPLLTGVVDLVGDILGKV